MLISISFLSAFSCRV